MSYVVASKVKEFAKKQDLMVSGDFTDHLNKVLGGWFEQGVKVAKANDRKTVRGGDLMCFTPGKMGLAVASKVKEYFSGAGMMSAGDLPDYVGGLIEWLVGQAADRAKANGRKTLRGYDL